MKIPSAATAAGGGRDELDSAVSIRPGTDGSTRRERTARQSRRRLQFVPGTTAMVATRVGSSRYVANVSTFPNTLLLFPSDF